MRRSKERTFQAEGVSWFDSMIRSRKCSLSHETEEPTCCLLGEAEDNTQLGKKKEARNLRGMLGWRAAGVEAGGRA